MDRVPKGFWTLFGCLTGPVTLPDIIMEVKNRLLAEESSAPFSTLQLPGP